MNTCPCGSGQSYADCCEPYLTHKQSAPSPEALMRSRYTAYTKADIDYIERTMKGPALVGFNKNESLTWANKAKWLSLNVISASQKDKTGEVEFAAFYELENHKHMLHERSHFQFENDQWYYVDGETPRIGRNDLCPCGSTKKFKKCCGSKS